MASVVVDLRKFVSLGKKIIAVGRNYKGHALELGNPMPDSPLLFMKPTSAYVLQGKPVRMPPGCNELHYEVELGIVINKQCSKVSEEQAMDFVGGYALALDMTARDLQDKAKEKRLPWTIAKGFDTACPIGDFIPKDTVKDPHNIVLWLNVNGELRQKGNTKDMHFKIPTLLSYISSYFTLEPGDLILSGTPAGVGPVKPGDILDAGIEGITQISFTVSN